MFLAVVSGWCRHLEIQRDIVDMLAMPLYVDPRLHATDNPKIFCHPSNAECRLKPG